MDTFPLVRRADEAEYGLYKTKAHILAVYDALAEATRTGTPYQTRLDPPPADPRVAHPARLAITAPIRREIKRERAASYIILLLRTWNRPVARAVLEPGLVLMLNDAARQAILVRQMTTGTAKQLHRPPKFVPWLDGLLGDMQTSRFITVETVRGQQVFRVGPQAPPTDNAPAGDVQKVKETLRALEVLGEDRASVELEDIVHDTYDLVP